MTGSGTLKRFEKTKNSFQTSATVYNFPKKIENLFYVQVKGEQNIKLYPMRKWHFPLYAQGYITFQECFLKELCFLCFFLESFKY